MNKRLLFIIVGILVFVLVAVVSLVAIAKNKNRTTSPSKSLSVKLDDGSSSNRITIEYWGLWEPESVMKPIIDEYESQNPGVHIVYTQKSFTNYKETVLTRIQQGSTAGTPAPDIFRIHNTWLPQFQNYLAPAPADVISINEYKSSFYPVAENSFVSKSQIYAIPWEVDGLVLYYNKSLFKKAGLDKPPSDWDTLYDYAKKLTKRDSAGNITQAGIALGSANNVQHADEILQLLFLQSDVKQSSTGAIDLTSDKVKTAVNFYVKFVDKEKGTWSPDLPSSLEMFYSGKLAMMIAPSWRTFDIISSAPKIEFDTVPVPQLPGNTPVTLGTFWGEAVSASSKHQLEAWNFLKFLTAPEQERKLYSTISQQLRAFGEPYSQVSLGKSIQDDPYVGAVIKSANTFASYKFKDSDTFSKVIMDAIADINGGTSVSSALTEANNKLNK